VPGPPGRLGDRGAGVEGHKHRVKGRGGRPPAALAGGRVARCRTASGLRAGLPRPCRVKALRSDGQVVPARRGRMQPAELFGQGEGTVGPAERAFQLAERLGSVRDGRNALVGWAVLFEG
jgi:hypothetical protein